MKYFYFMTICILFSSCVANSVKTVKGKWKQEFLSYKSQPTIIVPPSDEALIDIKRKKAKLIIEFDFSDGYEKDQTDSVVLNFPSLRFRKINLDKTSNYYDLIYQSTCDCFFGEMKSFSGNVLNIKLTRISNPK